ncbi:diguanylate cyclase [Methylobacterium sp. J-026]|uniref:sensor domain-containing diguanylate cyclase n=1 Tax=Methylobacterium sp. J-026 TaxID=2836624 RepID=UPI001FBA44D1|nr:sensor domain-containing diguanylate cyclase [Methylobacterium sp. J-026]MCJ2134802.1 diguanylate cyclase [Methylobacterium sp. J-026]
MTARSEDDAARLIGRGGRPVGSCRRRRPGRSPCLGPGLIGALDSLPHGLCLFDAADRLLFVSAGYRRLFGGPSRRVRPGLQARDVSALSLVGDRRAGQDPADLWAARRRSVVQGGSGSALQTLPDGRQIAITVQPQSGGGWAALCEDVTERRRTETLLRYMAQHDPLTGLPNRSLFAARLDRALGSPSGESCALLCLDLDSFKPVNDDYGHAVGDALLQRLAERLQGELRDSDMAAHLGGDEFSVLLAGTDPAPALTFALRLQDRLAQPYDLGAGRRVCITAAIGIACAPLHATRAPCLTERADAAMYEAKRTGRPCIWDARLLPGSMSAPGDHRPNPER